MTKIVFRTRILPAFLLAAAPSLAVTQQRPAIRQLGPVVARSAESFSSVAGVRHLSDGRVLLNDLGSRRVVLLDATLAKFTVVADSTSATGNAYGGRFGGLVAYRGDSTIFVDPQSLSMLVLDASGKVARVMSVPRSQDAMMLAGGLGGASFDRSGRLVYRASPSFRMRGAAPGGSFVPPEMSDSAAIVRVHLATRQVDTAGFIKTPRLRMDVSTDANGRVSMTSQINPLPVVDDWALMPDGSIAFIRGNDYHVDWVSPQGVKTSSTKIPFEWQRLTDEDKVAFIDSVKAARERMRANAPPGAMGAMLGQALGGGAGAAMGAQITIQSGPPGRGGDGGPPRRDGPGATRREGGRAGGPMAQVNFVPPSELPDYKPPFFAGSSRGDAEGNIWIRTIPTRAIAGGPVYDVVNRKGELVERVQVPAGRVIIGFGSGGVVYLSYREKDRTFLERAKVR